MKNFIIYLFLLFAAECSAQAVVINEVYGAGGNAGAVFTHDFIELYNYGPTSVDLAGWSVQYASATSTSTWQVTALSGVIEPGRRFLIQEAGGVNGLPLPMADVIGTLSMAATAGKVALVQSVAPLSGACPASALVVDKVGYGGSANCFEGVGPAPAPSATLSVQRQTDGVDSNSNASDFRTAAPSPANSLPRSQVITFALVGTHAYGDPAFDAVATASSGLAVTITSSDPSVASISGMTVTIVGAGNVDLTASQAGNGTFSPTTSIQTLHVEKALLQASTISTSRPAGVANPSFQISYSGFVGQDTESVLDVPPVASCLADLASLPGNYPIAISGGVDNNYEFTYSPGTLTILPSAVASPCFVLSPRDGVVDVFVNPTIQVSAVNGATTYVLQVSDDPSFSSFMEMQGSRVFKVTGLHYGTAYFARARTNQAGEFGRVTRFTTADPAKVTVLQSPAPQSAGVGLSPTLKFAEVPGAAVYSFELSLSASFTSIIAGQSGQRTQGVRGLVPATIYFVRVKTDLSPAWGPVRTFHTASLAELCWVRYPTERFSQISWLPEFVLNDVGATAYVVHVSESIDFTSALEFGPVGIKFPAASPLKFRTLYYTRVRAANEPDNWGPVRMFTTAHPSDFSLLRAPGDGSVGVDTLAHFVLSPVPGASGYSLSLSTHADFADEVSFDASTRSLWVPLKPFTPYYARVRTNLSDEWGSVTHFTTGGGGKKVVSTREATVGGLVIEEAVSEKADPERTSVQAFPNPFTESLTLCPGQAAFVNVTDLQGRMIFKGRVSARECCELGAGWSPGVYIASFVTDRGMRTIRLVKSP